MALKYVIILDIIGHNVDASSYFVATVVFLMRNMFDLIWFDSKGWDLRTIDQVMEDLLQSDICCSIALPRLPKRVALEDSKLLKGARVSVLDEDWDVSCISYRLCVVSGTNNTYDRSIPPAMLASIPQPQL